MNKQIFITIIISLIVGIFIMGYGFIYITASLSLGNGIGALFIVIVAAAIAGLIYSIVHNMNERIKEIKEEKSDDLSKY